MDEATPEMKMARRIAAGLPGTNVLQQQAFRDGMWDDAPSVQAALAAIIETQRLDAELAAWAHMVPPDGGSPTPEECALAETIAAAIRDGRHYGARE